LVFEDSEGDVKELAHNGTTNGQRVKLSGFQGQGPVSEWFAPTPSNSRWQEEGFAQKRITDLAEAGFAIEGATGKILPRSQSNISG
jgi:hypothetical protein